MSDRRERLYGDQEISRILKRAAELQEEAGPTEGYGLSLDELQQVAAEAGLDPANVARAVAELEAGHAGEASFHWLGAPSSLRLERRVRGTLTEAARDDVIAEIRRTFEAAGTFSEVGRTLEWTHQGTDEQVQVTVTSRGEQTAFHIFWEYPRTKRLAFAPAMLAALFVAVNLIIPLSSAGLGMGLVVVLLTSLLAAVFMAARLGFSRAVQKRERKAWSLLDRLEQIIPAPESTQTGATSRIDEALLEDEAPNAASTQRAASRREASQRYD